MKLPFKLDAWQEEVLKAEGNLCVCSGRQVGKSQIVAIKVAEYLARHKGTSIMVISITEDQAELMLQKILEYLFDNYKSYIGKGKNKPTKHKIFLNNKSKVYSKAAGQSGLGIRGHTVDVLVVDEAAYVPEAVWSAATPTMLTTKGGVWLLSTPNARSGYFWKAYTQPRLGYKCFHVSSEVVAEARPEPMRGYMLETLAVEKESMSELEYAQNYLAQFLEQLAQLFPDELIERCQVLERVDKIGEEYYLGVDVARMGGDETTLEVLERRKDRFYHRENKIFTKVLTTETTKNILKEDERYNFKRIYIDDGGLGVAVFDQLLLEDATRRKTVALNNASRPLVYDKSRTKKILKEDLYMNLLRLMERGEINLLSDSSVFLSLKSVMCETSKDKNRVRIHGRYTHIAEGLIRAAWAARDKKLNLFVEFM